VYKSAVQEKNQRFSRIQFSIDKNVTSHFRTDQNIKQIILCQRL
jgi:hypothetical protein